MFNLRTGSRYEYMICGTANNNAGNSVDVDLVSRIAAAGGGYCELCDKGNALDLKVRPT